MIKNLEKPSVALCALSFLLLSASALTACGGGGGTGGAGGGLGGASGGLGGAGGGPTGAGGGNGGTSAAAAFTLTVDGTIYPATGAPVFFAIPGQGNTLSAPLGTGSLYPSASLSFSASAPGTSTQVGSAFRFTFTGSQHGTWGCDPNVATSSCTLTLTAFGPNAGDAISGTFSGTLAQMGTDGPATVTVTDGAFSVSHN